MVVTGGISAKEILKVVLWFPTTRAPAVTWVIWAEIVKAAGLVSAAILAVIAAASCTLTCAFFVVILPCHGNGALKDIAFGSCLAAPGCV